MYIYTLSCGEVHLIASGEKNLLGCGERCFPVEGMKYQLFEEIFSMDCK